jgi:hypothetical protein
MLSDSVAVSPGFTGVFVAVGRAEEEDMDGPVKDDDAAGRFEDEAADGRGACWLEAPLPWSGEGSYFSPVPAMP